MDFTTFTYRSAAAITRRLPARAVEASIPVLGRGASHVGQQRRGTIARHLRRADPTLTGDRLDAAVAAAYESYVRYWTESFRLPYLDATTVLAGMETDGYTTHVLDALGAGRGVILALPHLGGWEWAGRWLVERGHGLTVVVEALEPPELFAWFADLRRQLGMNVVALGEGAATEVLAALRRNDVVCLLCDRNVGGAGVEVDFFGELTSLPAGPATLALRSGAPILPTAVYFAGESGDASHVGLVRPPIDLARSEHGLRADVKRVTSALAGQLEVLIRLDPTQWHLFQPNWPSDPGYTS